MAEIRTQGSGIVGAGVEGAWSRPGKSATAAPNRTARASPRPQPWLRLERNVAAALPEALTALGLILAAAYFFVGIGSYGLLDNNEGLYAQIARAMAHGDGLVIPQLNGVPYMEKPPLFPYLVAACFRLFGEAEWSARLVSSLAAFGCLGSLIWFGRRVVGKHAAAYAVLVLGSSLGFVAMARVVMPDMLLTALFNGALLAAYAALSGQSRPLWRASLVLLALATLTKGLLAPALFVMVVGGFAAIRRRDSFGPTVRFLADPLAWLLFLLVATPWHIAAAMVNHDFAWFYFINEHVLRFLGQRVPRDYYSGGAWYYVPRLLLFLFPWPIFLLVKSRRSSPAADSEVDLRTFLWLACLVPGLFFSASLAKANYYMVVTLPPLALLIGMRIHGLVEQGRQRLLAWPAVALAAILAIGGGGYWISIHRQVPDVHWARLETWAIAVAASVLAGMCGAFLALRRRSAGAMVLVALMSAPWIALLLESIAAREADLSSRPLAAAVSTGYPDADVFIFQDFERMSSLPFYLRRPVRIVNSKSNDLYYGQHRGVESGTFVTVQQMLDAARLRPAVLIVERSRQTAFGNSGLGLSFEVAANVGEVAIYRAKTHRPMLPPR